MHISWHGLTCIKIQTTEGLLLINPYQDSVGVNMPKLKVDVVACTNARDEQTNNLDRLQGDPFRITCPGEYEYRKIMLYGIEDGPQTLFVIEAEGISLGHLGKFDNPLNDTQLEVFEGVDVLFLPVSTMNTKTRSAVISQIEPRIIIPTQYKTPHFKVPLEKIDAFAKEMGVKNTTGEPKIILKKKDLPAAETQTIILQQV